MARPGHVQTVYFERPNPTTKLRVEQFWQFITQLRPISTEALMHMSDGKDPIVVAMRGQTLGFEILHMLLVLGSSLRLAHRALIHAAYQGTCAAAASFQLSQEDL